MTTMPETRERTLVRCLIVDTASCELLVLLRGGVERFGHGLWELLQGGRDAGETAEQAMLREIEEEIGVNVQPLLTDGAALMAPVSCAQFDIAHDDGGAEDWLNVNYVLAGDGLRGAFGELVLDDSHEDARWVSADEALAPLGTHDYSRAGAELIGQMADMSTRMAAMASLLERMHR
jgi:8-oxo-dGTP pyrophosphatase MutT (NUDIX family)